MKSKLCYYIFIRCYVICSENKVSLSLSPISSKRKTEMSRNAYFAFQWFFFWKSSRNNKKILKTARKRSDVEKVWSTSREMFVISLNNRLIVRWLRVSLMHSCCTSRACLTKYYMPARSLRAKVKNVSRAFLRDSIAISNYSTRARLINARSDKCRSMPLPRYRISRRNKKEIVMKIR